MSQGAFITVWFRQVFDHSDNDKPTLSRPFGPFSISVNECLRPLFARWATLGHHTLPFSQWSYVIYPYNEPYPDPPPQHGHNKAYPLREKHIPGEINLTSGTVIYARLSVDLPPPPIHLPMSGQYRGLRTYDGDWW